MEEFFAETFPAFGKHFKLSKISLKWDILVHTTYIIIISVCSRDRPENCADHALAFFVAPFPDNLVESWEGGGERGKRMGVGVRLFSFFYLEDAVTLFAYRKTSCVAYLR